MNTSSENKIKSPNITQALLAGFNTIANKPYLILFPVLLDLFLWFGPAWRVDRYFLPIVQSLENIPGISNTEYASAIKDYVLLWQEFLANFNLATTLRTLPIGVPSLMVSKPPFLNPLGQPLIFNLENSSQVLGIWFLLLLVGFFIANLYLKNISTEIIKPTNDRTLASLMRTFFQIILMPILLIIILIILSIPAMIMFTLITLVSPTISQFVIIIAGMVLLWVLMPLIFTPHSIFLFRQNLISAMMTSISVVRTSMTKTAWFILLSYVLIEGMDLLWQTPPVDNWFLIIGIFGHAFVVTAVVAASFHYFIDAATFTQTVMNNTLKSA